MKYVSDFFCSAFHAEQISVEDYSGFCEDEVLLGLRFPSDKINYVLMSETDFIAFSDEEKAEIKESSKSPFNNLILIFYRDGSEINAKLINGMAGKLLEIASIVCELLNKEKSE